MIEQTPGPWEVTSGIGERLRVVDASHNVPCIATVHGRNGNVEADARLIAAAPDLLEALREMIAADLTVRNRNLVSMRQLLYAQDLARNAIAKVERGERELEVSELEVDGDET